MRNVKIRFLCSILHCSPEEIIKHTVNVYEWEGILWEVVGVVATRKKHKKGGILVSHYTLMPFENREFYIRELGKKSELYKKIRG